MKPTDAMIEAVEDAVAAELQRWTETQVRMHQSLNAVMLRGANAVQVGTGGTAKPTTSPGSLIGWSLRETGGAAASLRLRDGEGGAIVATIALAAAASSNVWQGPGGVALAYGLFVEVVAGAVEGAVYLRGPE